LPRTTRTTRTLAQGRRPGSVFAATPPDPRLCRALGPCPKGGLGNGLLIQASLDRIPLPGLDLAAEATAVRTTTCGNLVFLRKFCASTTVTSCRMAYWQNPHKEPFNNGSGPAASPSAPQSPHLALRPNPFLNRLSLQWRSEAGSWTDLTRGQARRMPNPYHPTRPWTNGAAARLRCGPGLAAALQASEPEGSASLWRSNHRPPRKLWEVDDEAANRHRPSSSPT
jgi:hypothetical protein